MSFNLVDLIKDQVSGQVLGQISNAVGETPEATKAVVESAIPAVLSGIIDKASSEEGAVSVFDAVINQDDSILDNLSGLIGSANKETLIENGSGMVSSLLGGEGASGLVGKISSATSVAPESASAIVGMVTPMVMSTVKRFMAGGGEMDTSSLTNMLLSQKDNITAALPSGLDASDLPSSAGGVAATSGSSWVKKLIPIALLATLAFVGYSYFAGAAMEKPADTIEPVKEISTLTNMVPGGGDVTNQLKGLFDTAQTSLGSITDVESAKAALPALTDFSGKLDNIASMSEKLPEAAKPIFNSVVQGGLGQMQPMLDKAMAIPGVGAVLGGVIEPLKQKLTGLVGE